MKKIKYIIPLVILFIAIGFAAISYTLNLDGNAGLAGDLDNFNVYYSNTYVNGVEDYSVITSPTELDFTTTLKEPGTTYSITYDVTNGSKHFDAQLTMTCTSGDTYMSIVNELDTSTNLEALGTRSGTITLKKLKSIASNEITKKTISCTLTATPVERTTLGEGTPIDKQYAVLKATTETDTTMFRSEAYKQKIKTITFQDTINVPNDAIESWDIGVAQNGNVMAYVVTNPDDDTMYDLYIQANGKIYANRDMSYWFYDFQNLDAINNLNLLDTSSAVNMSGLFCMTGYNSAIFTMDVSNFDTSNVTDMQRMFDRTGYSSEKIVIDVSGFDTSNVTNMFAMFQATGYNNKNFLLDVSNFKTGNVTTMKIMFNHAGEKSEIFILDLSGFDTGNVTDMNGMLAAAGKSNPNFTLDVSNFNTSKVTDMSHMFNQTGLNAKTFYLDLSNFDTSNVTNMTHMFNETGFYSETYTLKLSNFDTSNVTDMSYMFSSCGAYSKTIDFDLGDDFDTSNVTNMSWMFYQFGYYSLDFNLDISHFNTNKVINMSNMFYGTGASSTNLNIIFAIKSNNIQEYTDIFKSAAKKSGSQITVNYTSETEALVDAMIATKSSGSNVVKGTLVQ